MRTLATDCLAGYRLTRLVTRDTLTEKPRRAVQHWALDHRKNWLYDFAECPWCVGMWVALGVVAARRLAPKAWEPLATALAVSAATGIIAEHT